MMSSRMEVNKKAYKCGMELTMDIIGGKWKTVILWHLRNKTLRFNEIRKRLGGITQKMLTQQLRELESDGLIERKVYAEVPPKVEYSLTKNGEKVVPVLYSIYTWGIDYARELKLNLNISDDILNKIINREI